MSSFVLKNSFTIAAAFFALAICLSGVRSYQGANALSERLIVAEGQAYARSLRGNFDGVEELLEPEGLRGLSIFRRGKKRRSFGSVTDAPPPALEVPERRGDIARVTVELPKRRIRRRQIEKGTRLVFEFVPTWADAAKRHGQSDLLISVVIALLSLGVGVFLSRLKKRAQHAEQNATRSAHLAKLGEMSAVLAHEIKNPLASLKGHAQLLQEKLDAGKHKDKAGLVVDEAKRIQLLVSDLLDFARSPQSERISVDLKSEVERVFEDFPSLNLNLFMEKSPPSFALESGTLSRVLSNLLDNARTWAKDSPIDVTLEGDSNALHLSVRDRGPGLPEGKDVFEPFFTRKTRGGAGLGLAIVKRLAQRHGGDALASNSEGGGALFKATFCAPLAAMKTKG